MAPLPALFALASLPSFSGVLDKPGYDETNLAWLKLVLAIAALAALAYEASRESEGRPLRRGIVKSTAAALAVMGVLAYFQFFQVGYKDFYHRWEFFHYYVGAKYFDNVGYDGLYACTAVAEAELGFRQDARARTMRDLRANTVIDASTAVDAPDACTHRFTGEQWSAFKQDVGFFRRVSAGSYWKDMQKDHGYNPPPVWTITGALFAKMHPAVEWYMQLLSCLDIGLFAAMFGMLAWAFGWRVVCVALVFWGTQAASPFYWTGGAFLRQDWLFYLVASVCMARKQRYFWSGAALAYSTLLRGFPVLFFAGWIVTAVAHFVRARSEPARATGAPAHASRPGARGLLRWVDQHFGAHHRKLAAGAVAAALVLIPTSIAVCGAKSWPDFAHQIAIHTELSSTNRMGWQVVVEQGAEGRMQSTRDNHLSDPFAKWKAARRDRLHALRPVHLAGVAIAIGAFVYACWRVRTPWVALALGCVLPTVSLELACYYYSYFLLCATLSRGRRPIEFAMLGAAALSELCALRLGYFDDRFTAMSLVFLELALFAIVMYARPITRRARDVANAALAS